MNPFTSQRRRPIRWLGELRFHLTSECLELPDSERRVTFPGGRLHGNHEEKIDEMSLALLYVTTFKDKVGFSAGKSDSWRSPSPYQPMALAGPAAAQRDGSW
jgi:hypothetical protein